MVSLIIQKRELDMIGFFFALIGYLFTNASIYATSTCYAPWTGSKPPSWLQATQAFLVLNCIFMTLSFLFDRAKKFAGAFSDSKVHLGLALNRRRSDLKFFLPYDFL